jgi:alkylation response protein AidB-like acyl-CoA dehydrogenase
MYYQPPLDDIRFLLQAFDFEAQVHSIERFSDFDLETCMELLEAYSGFCVEVLQPLNRIGDTVGVVYDAETRSVTLPEGFKEAYQQYCANGFSSIALNPEYGGIGAPFTIATLAQEIITATNKSLSMCPGLNSGLIEALEAHGSDELKERFLSRLVPGEWAGTMCLTEPQCGTDLGLLTTQASPYGDHFVLSGTKIWITFGEHDMTENIVHLVLARLPDSPDGVKGISAFVVPKFLEDGSRNPIFCGSTDHKMGIHASPTCVMNLEEAEGWLVGEPHRGMRSMFTMMNAARLQVGGEGVALGEAAYQAALAFAKDRSQSRSLDPAKRDPNAAADNILVHPDVRRMLLNVKSTTQGLRGLVTWMSIAYDVMHNSDDAEAKERAGDLVSLLTPIIKSYGSERGFQNISEAMQVMGGAGYTQDWPVEQYLRDERIAMIYEGTNHIQALDLVGRKLSMKGGALMRTFAEEVSTLLGECASDEALKSFVEALGRESKRLHETTLSMGAAAMRDPELVGAVSSNYLNQFALVTLGYVWLRQAKAVLAMPEDAPLRRAKLQTARFYFEMVLPEAEMYANKVAVGKGPMVDIDVGLL